MISESRKKLNSVLGVAAIFLLACIFVIPAHAQLAGANLSGVVTDSLGAAVPSAKLVIKNLGTGETREVSANSDGLYSAPNLLPGSYEVTVTAKGFSTLVQKGLTLTVGAEQSLNFAMKVGELSQQVEVDATPPNVETSSSTLSATVEQQTVVELPLNGRDWTQLATLQPGVLSIRAQASTGSTANRGNRGFGDALADSGHRPNENTYRIDGININDYSNGAPGSTLGANLGVDAIQEFNVVTTNYTAEYGRTSGAVINAITKSGTNQFHGSGYFFDRDRAWDARNFFDPAKIPPFLRKQFGGSGGGPIIKGKTFFFADYEGVRESQSLSFSDIVPTQAARSGALAAGNVTVDPRVVPYLALWPLPNAGAGPTADTGIFKTGALKTITENYVTTKVDHKFSDKDSLNGSYFFDNSPQSIPDSLNNFTSQIFTRRQMFGATESHIFSPALANVARLGFNRVVGLVNTPGTAINKAAGDTTLGLLPGLDAPLIGVTGITAAGGLGNPSFFGHHYNSFQGYDDVFFTRGTHSFKFGFVVERMQYDVLSKVRQNGNFNFSNLSNFLTDQPLNVLLLSPNFRREVGSRDTLFGGYFQDDYRVRSNLTINYGVRYEMLTNPTEAHNQFGLLNSFYATATGTCPLPIAQTTIQGCTVPVNSMWQKNPTLHNFDPRIGLSYDPFKDGKTAIRAGFGFFDVLPLPYVYTIGDSLTLPFSLQVGAANLPQGAFPIGVLSLIPFSSAGAGARWVDPNPKRSYSMNWNLNIQHALTSKITAQIGYVGSHTIHEPFTTDDSNMVIPTMSSAGLLWPANHSGIIADPNAGFIRPIFFDGTSRYNGLQAQLQGRDIHGLQTQVAYTWGKCLDDGSGAQLGDPFQNSLTSLMFFTKLNRHGPCDFDIQQNLSVNYLYSIPGPKGDSALAWVAGGWQVGGIITASTGVPFTLVQPGDPLGQNSSDPIDLPSRISGCDPYNQNYKNQGMAYINTNCFVYPSAPASFAAQCSTVAGITNRFSPDGSQVLCPNILGNAGRNQLVGPNLVNVDFSVIKNTHVPKVSETFAVQLRFEFFNILNHANFQAPVDNLSFGGFGALVPGGAYNSVQGGTGGVIDSTTTTSRQIQLGVKVIW